jgi:hypothetical protein
VFDLKKYLKMSFVLCPNANPPKTIILSSRIKAVCSSLVFGRFSFSPFRALGLRSVH